MTDPILDDVQALLDKEHGDKRILEQILRAAKNEEVISNFERNYVRKLAEKHLGKKPLVERKIVEEKKIIPDVVIPPAQIPKPQTLQTWKKEPKVTKASSKNTKMVLFVAITILIIIVGVVAIMPGGEVSQTPEIIQQPRISTGFSIETDFPSYQRGDIISISGNSNSGATQVKLSIKNTDEELVWSEEVTSKNTGQFSTLTFAGGSGWEEAGTYTVIAEVGPDQTTNSFSFSG